MEFRRTDVLVIGGGIAGLRAAIAARAEGAKVILLSKRKAGKSGASLVANTGHRIFSPGQPVDAYTQTMKSSQGLAEADLVKVMADESYDAITEMIEWGCPLELEYINQRPTYARCKQWKGILLTEPLRRKAEAVGVEILDGYTALRLLNHSGRVRGAFAVARDEQLFCFLAGSVVLAAGGVGQLYHPTDNPVDICGDGIALAWDAGAEVMDLEFVQFYPYQLQSPMCMDLHITTFQLGAHLVNQNGVRFMEEYPEQELVTRDLLSREMFLQDGPVYLDLVEVDFEELQKFHPRLVEKYWEDEDLVVSPIQHFAMGGVRMDAMGHSSLPGLYVCGEVAAGVHGANRLGGNALTECSVFGRRAGRTAAQDAKGVHWEIEKGMEEELAGELYIPEMGSDRYWMDRATLGHLMWETVGIVRDGEALKEAMQAIRGEIVRFEETRPRSILEWYQMRHMLVTAHLIAEAAYRREESRGAHYRLDFPETDPMWEGHLVICQNSIRFEKMK